MGRLSAKFRNPKNRYFQDLDHTDCMKISVKERSMSSSRVLIVLTQIMVMAVVIAIILLFMGIGVLILIHLCIVGRAFRRSFRTNRGGVSSVSPTNSSAVRLRGVMSRNSNGGMSEKDVQKLPSYKHGERELLALEENDKINGSGNVYDRTECAVCLDGYERGDTCRVLPMCSHSFHAKCVDSWLYKNPMCPICRTSAENQDCGEGGKEGLEVGRSGDCEARRLGGDFAVGIGGESGSGFHQVSATSNSTSARSVPSSPSGDEISSFRGRTHSKAIAPKFSLRAFDTRQS